ncbi:MAG: hypothetical protein L0Y73_03345 [Candidatus Aminicenantes bacterium]|nr:hypothetical protein [Candidatus Aminicenantes bacterium]
MDVYEQLEKKAVAASDFLELAKRIANELQDTSWVKRLYEKAADKVKSIADLRKIAHSIPPGFDKEFEKKLYLRILDRTASKEEYIMFAQLMAIFLKDSEFAQKLCLNIEAIFLPKKTLEENYKNFLNTINGLSPQQKMEKFAEFLKRHKMNKHIKDIYFKAAKEFAQINKREALIVYLKYYQLSSREESKTEPIPDRVKKSIFKNELEYEAFNDVVEALKSDDNMSAALAKIDERYRKKIDLNKSRIAGIKSQHAKTLNRLSEILNESENEPEKENEKENENEKETTAAPIRSRAENESAGIAWNPIQAEFLALFVHNDYVLPREAVVEFARSKNLFESYLVNEINELFIDVFDDILIAEEETKFTIDPGYRESLSIDGELRLSRCTQEKFI